MERIEAALLREAGFKSTEMNSLQGRRNTEEGEQRLHLATVPNVSLVPYDRSVSDTQHAVSYGNFHESGRFEISSSLKSTDLSSDAHSGKSSFVTFPQKLMQIIESEEFADTIWWSSEGDVFLISPAGFTSRVIKDHFQGTKFESFTRKLNRWGFKRVIDERFPSGAVVYRHGLFQRGKPELLQQMKRGMYEGQASSKKRSARSSDTSTEQRAAESSPGSAQKSLSNSQQDELNQSITAQRELLRDRVSRSDMSPFGALLQSSALDHNHHNQEFDQGFLSPSVMPPRQLAERQVHEGFASAQELRQGILRNINSSPMMSHNPLLDRTLDNQRQQHSLNWSMTPTEYMQLQAHRNAMRPSDEPRRGFLESQLMPLSRARHSSAFADFGYGGMSQETTNRMLPTGASASNLLGCNRIPPRNQEFINESGQQQQQQQQLQPLQDLIYECLLQQQHERQRQGRSAHSI